MTRISVIGLGKLGACTAACFASKGFQVIGVDVNSRTVDAINKGIAPVSEPRLQDLITCSKGRLKATSDFAEAIEQTDVTFLIVPTPSTPQGSFSNAFLCDALKKLSASLKTSSKKTHLFVITSTVSPGTTEQILIPLIASESARELNNGFEVCYNPEFIALGSVINDFLNPDVVLIGQSSESSGRLLERLYTAACENKPPIARMSLVSAEITKISLNSYVTMKISFANTLATICGNIPGADVDDITRAIGADRRVSPYYLRGGLGYGGPCFPRDNRAFAAFARNYGVDAFLAVGTDKVNQFHTRYLAEIVLKNVSQSDSGAVAVIGLAYKPNTPVIEESAAIKLIEQLLANEVEVVVFDSLAIANAREHFGDKIRYASSVKDCFAQASVCVITTPADEFRSIDQSYICRRPTTIIDCWRVLNSAGFDDGVNYIPLGKNSDKRTVQTVVAESKPARNVSEAVLQNLPG